LEEDDEVPEYSTAKPSEQIKQVIASFVYLRKNSPLKYLFSPFDKYIE
jgi:hypothetical protein